MRQTVGKYSWLHCPYKNCCFYPVLGHQWPSCLIQVGHSLSTIAFFLNQRVHHSVKAPVLHCIQLYRHSAIMWHHFHWVSCFLWYGYDALRLDLGSNLKMTREFMVGEVTRSGCTGCRRGFDGSAVAWSFTNIGQDSVKVISYNSWHFWWWYWWVCVLPTYALISLNAC